MIATAFQGLCGNKLYRRVVIRDAIDSISQQCCAYTVPCPKKGERELSGSHWYLYKTAEAEAKPRSKSLF